MNKIIYPECAVCGKPIKDGYCICSDPDFPKESLYHDDCAREAIAGVEDDALRERIWNAIMERVETPTTESEPDWDMMGNVLEDLKNLSIYKKGESL